MKILIVICALPFMMSSITVFALDASSTNVLTIIKPNGNSGSGVVTGTGINCGDDCNQTYPVATSLRLTATPTNGATFSNWSGGCNGTQNTCVIMVNGPKTVNAVFHMTNTITVAKSGTGAGVVTGTGINCGSDCTEKYFSYTKNVTLTAIPDSGSSFMGWSGGCTGLSDTCVVSLTESKQIEAKFDARSDPNSTSIIKSPNINKDIFENDQELTNYKTGIDVKFSGKKGIGYAEEYFFHDKLLSDKKVVYLRDDTLISMSHNERNIGGNMHSTTIPLYTLGISGLNGNAGTIRYKIDRDMQLGLKWSQGPNLPAYTQPFDLSGQNYEAGVPVVGTTGPKPGLNITDFENYYYRGMRDVFGDEWHVLAVADDDAFLVNHGLTDNQREFYASDGKTMLLVVNPKTPALTLRPLSDASQFYTTPAKTYFVPKIHIQKTYLTDNVEIEIRDLYGNNVFYKVNDGAWTTGGAPSIKLNSTFLFRDGENVLEYYYNKDYVKKRVFVKNPPYPSQNEAHGNLLWKNENGLANVKARLTREPYKRFFEEWKKTPQTYQSKLRKGLRLFETGTATLNNAFVARILGGNAVAPGYSKTYAQYSKELLLENGRTIDPLGHEISHTGGAIPSRELHIRGYYDVDMVFDGVVAYDMLIHSYRADKVPGGITAIEDHYIRDMFAGFAFEALQWKAGWTQVQRGGMWDTARAIGGFVVALAMPSYSTPYYGTSGFDGTSTVYPWTPMPDGAYTWKRYFLDNDTPLLGYPNQIIKFGISEYNVTADGLFMNRAAYMGYILFGHTLFTFANLTYIHTGIKFPSLEKAFIKLVNGTMSSSIPAYFNEGNVKFPSITILNERFPEAAAVGIPYVKSLDSGHQESENKNMMRAGVYAMAWYDDQAGSVDLTTPPVISDIQVSDIGAKQATLTWATNKPSDSMVKWWVGESPTVHQTPRNSQLTTHHTVTITGLPPGTALHYHVICRNAAGLTATSADGTFTTLAGPENEGERPHVEPGFLKFKNVFNPAKESLEITYASNTGNASLMVYDRSGKEVKRLDPGIMDSQGYRTTWDGRNNSNTIVASGTYVLVLKNEGVVAKTKVVVVK